MCNSSKLTNSIRNYVKYIYTGWPQKSWEQNMQHWNISGLSLALLKVQTLFSLDMTVEIQHYFYIYIYIIIITL